MRNIGQEQTRKAWLGVGIVWLLGACAENPEDPSRAENVVASAPGTGAQGASSSLPIAENTEDRFSRALTGHLRARYHADLDSIKKRKVLRVITGNNSTGYFLYRGAEAGFHYELAKWFADTLGVRLEVVVPSAARDMIPWLLQGRGDLIVADLPMDAPRTNRVLFTRPFLHTTLVVVTRKNRMPGILQLQDLSSATLTVQPSSTAMKYLRDLSQDIGFAVHIKGAAETLQAEELLDQVSKGEIDATVVEKRMAQVEMLHLKNLHIAWEFDDRKVVTGFATLPENRKLWRAADEFLRKNYRGTVFNILYARYYKSRKQTQKVRNTDLRADRHGALTPWDALFQKEAQAVGLDWRLLAAQAVQESRLDAQAVSPYGARGLMQLMPGTARDLGVRNLDTPSQSIAGGAKYLSQLMNRFTSPKIALKDRVRFSLASYNVGPGHLDDARTLARRLGLNHNRWFENVEKSMLLLSKPKFFQNAKYGYCRGEEPVRYVSQIQSRYDNYVILTNSDLSTQNPSP